MNHARVELFRQKLDRFIISDYHGLKSPGLTCYLNSVLQVLFMTEDFRDAVKQSKDPTTIDPHLGEFFANLQKRMARTHSITRTLGITNGKPGTDSERLMTITHYLILKTLFH
ncbi:hypothetical protein L3Q82_016834 [Scortum barcoo]|uniref:Uncharacterized protein n=1 Tax=Scortum barcoo TaxID=214431 RepID=A0ACB8X8D7_9TELE|nr:hypothetical protein L3Q82_016834 [Scortum barcoo]